MKLFTPVSSLVVWIAFFTSCKNDLKLNAPYKEIPSIYAVLNPQDKIQIIRINKVFLGETDANQMAQIADSINYPEGELSVTLSRKNGSGQEDYASLDQKKTIVFRDSVIQAQPGAFNRTQRVYVSSDRLFVNGTYNLTVKNTRTGNVFTAEAKALDSISGNQPFLPIRPPYYPYLPSHNNVNDFINYREQDVKEIKVPFIPNEIKNGQVYNLTIRFHFYDSLFNGQLVMHHVDYPFANKTMKDVLKNYSYSYMPYESKPIDLFSSLGLKFSTMGLSDNVVGRRMQKIEYRVFTSSQDYLDYIQYTLPSLSVSQKKPLYSNFDKQAALGIFTFRSRCTVSKEMDVNFKREFATNEYTSGYRFY